MTLEDYIIKYEKLSLETINKKIKNKQRRMREQKQKIRALRILKKEKQELLQENDEKN